MWKRNHVQKLQIVTVDGFDGAVEAQYNPKEVQIDKTVNWQSDAAATHLSYTRNDPRTITMELLFDVFEHKGETLAKVIAILNCMAEPVDLDPKAPPEDRRPPVLVLGNGPIPGLRCVLESLSIKILVFDAMNRPVRATANVKLKELTQVEWERLAGGSQHASTREPRNWYRATDPRDPEEELRRRFWLP